MRDESDKATQQNPTSKSNILLWIILGVVIGASCTFIVTKTLSGVDESAVSSKEKEAQKPLYWVAPMDANYRKDKPGKSPMGMDLVPVYAEEKTGSANAFDAGVGTISIAANVINNLGVRTSTARYQSLRNSIKTVGYVAYDEDRLVHIHPRVEGWIEKLHVNAIGDPVKKGQPLYEIYSPELVNAQEEFLLAIDRKNKRLISAASNRLMALQLPQATINKLKKTRKVQQRITFYAPQNGVVENLNIRNGFFVKPGSTLMSIGDLSEVWVEAEVFERQAGLVKTGNEVSISLDYLPGRTWRGVVDFIYPTLDAKTRTVKVRLRFKNENGVFKPNMFAQITLHAGLDEPVLLIPKEALIRTGNQDRVVLALGEGHFKSIAVTAGRFDDKQVEIIAGLNEGDVVVSSAQFLLDSESSKASDFKRMQAPSTMQDDETVHSEHGSHKVSSASATGVVESIMVEHGMVTIFRSAIEKWQRPEASVDFIAAQGVSFNGLEQGMQVSFSFEIHGDDFVIVEIAPLKSATHAHH